MLRTTGMCRPNGLIFHQKSFDMGPILVQTSLEEGPISQKMWEKMVKLAIFEVGKTRRNGSQFVKISKRQISRFLREKNPKIWVGVSDRRPHSAHTRQKIIRVSHPRVAITLTLHSTHHKCTQNLIFFFPFFLDQNVILLWFRKTSLTDSLHYTYHHRPNS